MKKTVLVTGCSSGFGLATAAAFARAGDRVYSGVRDPSRAARLQQVASSAGGHLTILALDVTDPAAGSSAVARIVDEVGRLDVLVNNAGTGAMGAVESIALSDVRALFETNVFGVLHLVRAALPTMREQRDGLIVTVSSAAALLPGGPVSAFYAASKHAITTIMEGLAAEVATLGIRVALVEPGYGQTGAVQAFSAALQALDQEPASAYLDLERRVLAFYQRMMAGGLAPGLVADTILQLAHAPGPVPLHTVLGPETERAVQAARAMGAEAWQQASSARMEQVLAADQRRG